MPAVLLRDRHELCPSAGTINTDALSVRTKMPPPGEAIATMPAGDVTLGNDEIAAGEPFYMLADAIDDTDKLMPDDHRHRNCFLRPGIPVVDVHVRAADGRFQNADQHIVPADFWNGNLFEPQTRLGPCFDNRFHRRLHDNKTRRSGKGRKDFCERRGSPLCIKGRDIVLDLPKTTAGVPFFLDITSAFLAKPKQINKWLDMDSMEADSAGAGLPAHRGAFTDGQNKKGQREEN